MRLDGYIRVSRIGGRKGEGYISPDVQREAIERKARDLGGEVVAWHDDQDYSGGNLERPGFEEAFERIERGESDGLIVKRVDRFARDVPDGSTMIRRIGEAGGAFIACDEGLDHHPGDDAMTVHIHLTMAQAFLDNIKRGWAATKTRAIARGAHIGPTPIGYQRNDASVLVPHPVYGPAITELFTRGAEGRHGDTALARWMAGRAARENGRDWQPSEIRRWLANRVYLGEVRHGELVNQDAHEPLTDPETWRRCQRPPGQKHVRAGSPFLLAGLARCAACRYAMTGQSHGGANRSIPVYRCNGAHCSERSVVNRELIEPHVRGLVVERLASLRLEAAENGNDLGRLDREAGEAESDVQTYGADFEARRLIGEAAWRENLAELAAIRDAKREARDAGYSRAKLKEAATADVDSLDGDGLRDLFRGLIRVVFVRRRPRGAAVADRVRVIWSDDRAELDLPAPHHGGPFEPVEW